MKTIVRERYLERIKALKDTPDIKIITCIRRSGKSNLMQAYIDYLKSDFEDVNIIFIDYMDLDFEEIKEEVHNRSGSDSVSFIEVQFYIETFSED